MRQMRRDQPMWHRDDNQEGGNILLGPGYSVALFGEGTRAVTLEDQADQNTWVTWRQELEGKGEGDAEVFGPTSSQEALVFHIGTGYHRRPPALLKCPESRMTICENEGALHRVPTTTEIQNKGGVRLLLLLTRVLPRPLNG